MRKMSRLAPTLLAWYRQHGRVLPWRGLSDPYAIWVAEIMLQQTRVENVISYFEKWMRLFPSIKHLAAASEQEVLNAWEGLGYYSRARNLHRAARIVEEQHSGALPRELSALRALPGIGRYTAGAIASTVFNKDEPILDGNLKRVFARLFHVLEPVDSTEGEKILWELSAKYLPKGQAGDYNQALMDLGATVCTPKNPRCTLCPVENICQSRADGVQDQLPKRLPKKDVPRYVHAAGVISNGDSVLLAKRPPKGLLGGMWEFPNGRVAGDPFEELEPVLETEYRLRVQTGEALGVINHAYTHFRVVVHAFHCKLISSPEQDNTKWVKLSNLEDYPMGKVDRTIAGMLHG